ncbi:MAG: fructose-bisphosphatase class III, partial [Clostridia bacterium]|nr:fructose-bisphosphatase class III [Clostridia bacterium]
MNPYKKRLLELLSQKFPDIASATAEIINLNAILQLPKGTEHFMSDLHGEYEAFRHILKNASGVIRIKIDEVFGDRLTKAEKTALATLIYYPKERLCYLQKTVGLSEDWYRVTLSRLVELCRGVASTYTRSKVRNALPPEFSYIIEELLQEQTHFQDKDAYYESIVETILRTARGDAFLIALSHLIQRLAIDKLHILGDIFDRGPGPHIILDTLMNYHNVDIAWGNHDILWMGAAAGNPVCVAAVIRISARYDHLETLESGYGISLRQLVSFADTHYQNDPCTPFLPISDNSPPDGVETIRVARLHKAVTILQLKAEGALISRHPEYQMDDRLLLSRINSESGTFTIDGVSYPLTDTHFPTIDWNAPFCLTEEEAELLEKLRQAFLHSVRLQEHVRFLFSKGGMYFSENGNLMYHGCIPLEEDGSFSQFLGYSGKSLLKYC